MRNQVSLNCQHTFQPRVSHLVLKLHLVSGATNNNDFAEPAHASLAEALEDPSATEDFAKETAEADECNEEANALDENLGGVEVEAGQQDGSSAGSEEDYQPRYHDTTQPRYHNTTQPRYHADELEKLLDLADTSLDNKQTTFTASEIIDCSTEILESDLDLSINSTEVFHKSAMPVEEENDDAACDVNKDAEELDANKMRKNGTENQEEATIGAPDILLEPEPKEQKLAEQPEGERNKSDGRRKLPAAWQEEEHVGQTSEEGSAVNQRRLSSNAFLERDSKVGESPVEEKVRQEYGNTFLANRKPSKSLEQGQAGIKMKQQKDLENENERREDKEEPVELRRAGISPKPVPAPRHFFLRPTGKVTGNGEFTFI